GTSNPSPTQPSPPLGAPAAPPTHQTHQAHRTHKSHLDAPLPIPSQMLTLESASRAGCLVTFSITAGATIGIAAAACLVPDALFWGALVGAPIGAIVSPAIVAGLFRKPLVPGALIVFLPSLSVAMVAAITFPALTLASVVVFCAMAGLCYVVLPATV